MDRPGNARNVVGASKYTELNVFLTGIALIVFLLSVLPENLFVPSNPGFFFAIGLIGVWRYSWWMVHLVRAIWYKWRIYPALRLQASTASGKPPRIFVLCTSYRIKPETNFEVYDSLVKEVLRFGVPTTIYASISDRSDVEVIDLVLEENDYPASIEVNYMFQKGDGKRSAMGEVLRAIARSLPDPDSLLISMDGDIRLEPGTLENSLPFFHDQPELGAITTNNRAEVTGDDVTREWYDLRYAQRDLMMCSLSLSDRLLVLTGRYSVFRIALATHKDFIRLIDADQIEHWRFGKFRFLSGDDKSTWYFLLKNGWKMRYLPDVFVTGFEELPDRNRFFFSSIDLMKRWFGNMLRTSGRAIKLGPKPMGMFTWWSLVDQRLSMWTTLIGPLVAVLMTGFVESTFIFAYLLWVVFTRSIATLVLAKIRGRFSLLWIPLLYYNQIVGSILKTHISFRFNRQSWSRQGISSGEPEGLWAVRKQRGMGHVLHGVHIGGMLLILLIGTGILPFMDRISITLFFSSVFS